MAGGGGGGLPHAEVVVAIDVGTSGTGYTIAFRPGSGAKDLAAVDIIPRVPGLHAASTTKNLTAVLLRADDESTIAVGRTARDQYISACDDGSANDFLYFERFKMELASGARAGRAPLAMTVKALGANVNKPLLLPFTALLAFIREEALRAIVAHAGGVNEGAVGWVLTVPAIWDDEAKAFMRKAAHAAGMIPDEGSNRLLLALEPEAAALSSFVNAPPPLQQRFMPGKRSIIIDAGGGTVDITVSEFESTKPLRLKELLPASGGPWGGTVVDSLLIDFVRGLFVYGAGAHLAGAALMTLRDKWEDAKVNFKSAVDPSGGGTDAEPGAEGAAGLLPREDLEAVYTIDMGFTLDNFPEEVDGLVALKDGVAAYNGGKPPSEQVQLSKLRRLTLPASVVHRVAMEPVVQHTVRHVRGLLVDGPGCDVSLVLLAGGFAESSYLQQRIRESFADDDRLVVVPPQPGFAINKGAAYIGLSGNAKTHSVLRFSYALKVNNRWNPELHHPATKADVGGMEVSLRCLRPIVQKGASVSVNGVLSAGHFVPDSAADEYVRLEIYRTEEALPGLHDPRAYVWQGDWQARGVPGVPESAKVGEVRVRVRDRTLHASRPLADCAVEVEMLFGGSEIQVQAKAVLTGAVERCAINYEPRL